MRAPLLLLVLLLPGASAWSLDASPPATTASGLPLAFEACVTGPANASAELKAQVTLGGRTVAGSPRYGEAFPLGPDGRECRRVTLEVENVEGNASLLLRVRSAERDAAAAEWEGGLVLVRGALPPVRIRAAYGEPYEGVVLEVLGDASLPLAGVALAQGARSWPLPNATLAPGERVFVGERAPPDAPRHLPLRIEPRAGNVTLRLWSLELDRFRVPRLDAGEVATRDGVAVAGRTAVRGEPRLVRGHLTAFATPDAGAAPLLALLDGARAEVLVTGYTLTSEDVAAALLRAVRRGVDVRVLLEGAPVGGVPEDETALLAALAKSGARVAVLRGADDFPARYRTLHAKVIVVDRTSALVTTENLHDSSYPATAGAPGTRGFGILVENATLARLLADVHLADAAAWPDVQPPAPGAPAREPALSVGATKGPALRMRGAWNVTPVLSPDDPFALLDAMNATTRSLDVAMLLAEPAWRDGPNPFLDAAVAAARRGVRVRVLLDGHADPERNVATAAALLAAARAEGLPLEARVDDAPRTLHAKALVLDEARVYVGSMNWGRASARENREVGLLVDAPEVAALVLAAFEKDWEKEGPAATQEVTGLGGVAGALIVALSGRRLRRRGARGPRRG